MSQLFDYTPSPMTRAAHYHHGCHHAFPCGTERVRAA